MCYFYGMEENNYKINICEPVIVLTMYGKDETINNVSVKLFNKKSYRDETAEEYCNKINTLNDNGNEWIKSVIAEENKKIPLQKPYIKTLGYSNNNYPGALSYDEIDALMAGAVSSEEKPEINVMLNKIIVLTKYGKGQIVTDISISLFDDFSRNKNAENYCENINTFDLTNDNWTNAIIVSENQKIQIRKPLGKRFDIFPHHSTI